MKILAQMHVLLWLGLASAPALPAQVDAREVIRRAVAAEARNWNVARGYTFLERVEFRRLDSHGQLKSTEVQTYDVTLVEGSPYRRLTARGGRPLPPGEEKKEQEKLATSITERLEETSVQRAERVQTYEKRPEWQREAWRELPEAFDFRLTGEEMLDGRSLYVIDARPRRGYQPRSRVTRMFPSLHGKLWVDKQDYAVVKAEAEVTDTISVGLFLVRVAKGSRAVLEQARVSDGVWLPRRVQAFASVRLGLLKVLRFEQDVSYSRCRESQSDSPIVSRVEVSPGLRIGQGIAK
jgi:hypothetical protein